MELRAKYTLFAEGCRGHIGKQLIKKYNLDSEADAQHYGIGIKEIWDIDPSKHKPGLVVHTAGWPLNDENTGGSFLYHLENNQVFVGLIIDLSHSNPHLSPFDEFQRYKHHPVVKQYLEGGKRAYGARAICKGGLNSLPKMVFPGGALIGCDLGTLNFAKIKGSHTAMKSGMLAADAIAEALAAGREGGDELSNYVDAFKASWLYDELFRSRNFGAAIHKFGAIGGGAFNFIDQNIFGGKIPVTLHDDKPDYACLKRPAKRRRSTTRSRTASSASTSCPRCSSNTNHEEDQPIHLAGRREHSDREEPAALRRAGPALLPGRRVRSGGQRRRQQALPDQRAELRALQDLRHQGPGAEHHLGGAGRYRRAELPQHVRQTKKAPSGAFFMLRLSVRLRADGKELAVAPDAEPFDTVDPARHRQLDQLVEHVAMHQRLEVVAHPQAGRGSWVRGRSRRAADARRPPRPRPRRWWRSAAPAPASPCTCRVTATKGASSTRIPTFSTGVTRK